MIKTKEEILKEYPHLAPKQVQVQSVDDRDKLILDEIINKFNHRFDDSKFNQKYLIELFCLQLSKIPHDLIKLCGLLNDILNPAEYVAKCCISRQESGPSYQCSYDEYLNVEIKHVDYIVKSLKQQINDYTEKSKELIVKKFVNSQS